VSTEIKLTPLQYLNSTDTESVFRDLVRLLDPQNIIVCTNGTLLQLGNRDFSIDTVSSFCIKKESFSDIILQTPCIKPFKTSWGVSLPLPRNLGGPVSITSNITEQVFTNEAQLLEGLLKTYLRSNKIVQSLEKSIFKDIASKCGCILINGQKGSGRDSLINHEVNKFLSQPHFAFIKIIDCKIMRGKRLDSFEKVLTREFAEVFFKRPSIVILQDIDYLLPSFSPEEENTVEASHVSRMSLILMKCIRKLEIQSSTEGCRVVIIATSRGEHHLNKILFESNFFTHSIEVPLPDKDQRKHLLDGFCQKYFQSSRLILCDIEELASKTDGFSPGDLQVLTEHVHHLTLVSSSTANIESFRKVLLTFTPSSLRGASLTAKSNIKLNDVGGLGHVKQVIRETLLWPVKYPYLMRKCPIRPTSCLLLYGPPGTGKTLIAEAAANDVGINFISVEGPELLSKYIGASEQAVRDLFARAKSAKPCIIFFDEFDSIAPRRGADSTGVTDRVVNQLLTQMDGVEGLDRGIFILAATSRPDLIDPALLRPGRFDKWLRCNLPDQQERIEILKLLLRNITVEEDHLLDWNKLSEATNLFSGADLQSALFSAQVLAANRILAKHSHFLPKQKLQLTSSIECFPSSGVDYQQIEVLLNNMNLEPFMNRNEPPSDEAGTRLSHQEATVILSVGDIMEGVLSTKPSVSQTERVKFDLM
jgi:peroxin-1